MNLRFAELIKPEKIFILSAKYGLLDPEGEIDTYNLPLDEMGANEIRKWSPA
jgi:hypothetical protein